MNTLAAWIKKYKTSLDSSCSVKNHVVDTVTAGDRFIVKYLGSKDIGNNSECTTREILSHYLKENVNKIPAQEIIIDLTSITLRQINQKDQSLLLFTIPLSHVKDVRYRRRDNVYGSYCIFVSRDDLHRSLSAHVLLCDSSEKAAKIFKSLETAFNVGNKTDSRNCDQNHSIGHVPETI